MKTSYNVLTILTFIKYPPLLGIISHIFIASHCQFCYFSLIISAEGWEKRKPLAVVMNPILVKPKILFSRLLF